MPEDRILHRATTDRILGGFYHAYSKMGFGFPESIYANALAVELNRRGLRVTREVPVEIVYEGVEVGRFRLDMVVDDAVLIEIKATKAITDADTHQLLSYLKGTELEVGLLLHFGPKAWCKRFVYDNARKSQLPR